MNTDLIIFAAIIAVFAWLWGVANRGWTSPLDILLGIVCWATGHRILCRHHRRSDDEEQEYGPDPEDMSTPDVRGPLRPPQTIGPLDGAMAIDRARDRRAGIDHDPYSPELQPGETRIAWTRRQLEFGLLEPGEIDKVGAEKFGVDPRTVRRWRAQLRNMTLAQLERSERDAEEGNAK